LELNQPDTTYTNKPSQNSREEKDREREREKEEEEEARI
jgi:hypothetical protein